MKKFKRKGRKVIHLESIEIKTEGDEAGTGRAVFAVLGERDREGDTFMKGAFKAMAGIKVPFLGMHGPMFGGNSTPIGIGMISEEGNKAIFDFEMNMDYADAKAWHWYLGKAGKDGKYSFGFRDAEGKIDPSEEFPYGRKIKTVNVFEVSAAYAEAQESTGTLSLKAGDGGGDGNGDGDGDGDGDDDTGTGGGGEPPPNKDGDPQGDKGGDKDTDPEVVTMEQFNELKEQVAGLSSLKDELTNVTQILQGLQERLPEPDTSIEISL